ncbi:MAG: outer membrane protein assembly factor BamA [bacterium]|nr:outer membrane protein assembly factor BamA [bacterium]
MKKIFLFCLLLGIGSTSLFAEMIVDIKAQGIKRVSSDAIISISGLEIGSELTPESIQKAITQLYAGGLFENIAISADKTGNGVTVNISVKEWPIVLKVSFKGNKKFKSKKLIEICQLKEFNVASESAIFDAVVRIRQAYEKEGFYAVNITPDVKEENGRAKVKFTIKEGSKIKVKEVIIVGNYAFPDKKIRKLMKNRAKYWWPWSGKFNKTEFDEDPLRVVNFYQSSGYPHCQLVSADIVPVGNGEWANLRVEVSEGKPVYFGNVLFEGNEFLKTEELRTKLKFKKGMPYSKDRLSKTLEEIYGVYSDYGYLYLSVDPCETLDSINVRETVDVTFKIKEGIQARVHKIEIASNLSTHDNVIRRELTIFPGEIFSRKKLIVSQRKIFNLGFFKNVTVDTRQASDSGDIDLILNIEEKAAGQASAGASYYPKYGIVGNLSLSTPNLRGMGEYFSISYEKGTSIENITLGYQKPWLFDSPMSLGFNIYKSTTAMSSYNLHKIGGNTTLGFQVPRLDYTKASVSYTLENVGLAGETSNLTRWYLDQEGIRSMVGFGIVRDSRDNYLNPTTGSRNSCNVAFSGGIFGGDIKYHKEMFESVTYHRLFWRFVLGMRSKIGIASGYTPSENVPVYEKFILGGIGDWGLRGYKDWEIGPRLNGEIVGGNFASLFTIEAKLAFDENMYPLIFFDAGNTWPDFKSTNLQSLKKGVGVGFRIEIPMMGLIGFDMGYGIDAVPRDWEFHLQMGRTF